MARIVISIRGALANTLDFTSSSYLFSWLSKDDIARERKRHDLAVRWAQKRKERIDFINKQLRLERKVEANVEELNDAMRKYHEVFGHQLLPLPRKPVLSEQKAFLIRLP